MKRIHRIVHLISFVAIVAGLFSPVLSLPVTAEDVVPEPEVNLITGDDGTPASEVPEPTVEVAEPTVAPVLIAVAPAAPIITDAVCGEGILFAQTASAPVTEGMT